MWVIELWANPVKFTICQRLNIYNDSSNFRFFRSLVAWISGDPNAGRAISGRTENFYYLRDVPAPKVTCQACLQSAFFTSAFQISKAFSAIIYDSGCCIFDTVNNFGCDLLSFSINSDCDFGAPTVYSSHPGFNNPDRTRPGSIEPIELIRILCFIAKRINELITFKSPDG